MFHCTLLSSKTINMFCCSDHHHQTTNRRCDATVTSMTQHRTAHWFNSSLLEPRIRVSVTEGRTRVEQCLLVMHADAELQRGCAGASELSTSVNLHMHRVHSISLTIYKLACTWCAYIFLAPRAQNRPRQRPRPREREKKTASQCGWCNKCLRPGGKSHKYTRAAGYNVTHTL